MCSNGFGNFRQFLRREVGLWEILVGLGLNCLFVFSGVLLGAVSDFSVRLGLFVLGLSGVSLGVGVLWLVLCCSNILFLVLRVLLLRVLVLRVLILALLLVLRIMRGSQTTNNSSLSVSGLSWSLLEILSIFVIVIIDDLIILLM